MGIFCESYCWLFVVNTEIIYCFLLLNIVVKYGADLLLLICCKYPKIFDVFDNYC
jgi:hypothetical protein